MKHVFAAILLTVVFIAILPAAPALAEGISITSGNGDQIKLFEDIYIEGHQKGNVIAVLGDINVDGAVEGQVISVFGDITVNARVEGQVVTVFGKTELTGNADIEGNLITVGALEKAGGASVSGQEVRILGRQMDLEISSIFYLRLVLTLLFTAGVLIVGLIILILSPKKQEETTRHIRKRFEIKAVLGFLTFISASIIAVLLAITVLVPGLYMILMIIANIYASIFLGEIMIGFLTQSRNIFLEFFTGLTTITIVKFLAIFVIPQQEVVLSIVIGAAIWVIMNSIGLGILMEAKFAREPKNMGN